MNIVIVDAQVVYSSINYNNDGNNDNFSVSDDGTHVSIYSGQPDVTDKHAMDCTAQVLMRGGGNDCRLGLTKMRVGWLQNGVDVDKTAYYNAVGQPGMTFYYALPPFGHLLALKVTPANEQERAQVGDLVKDVQEVTGENVEVAFVDQGYTGEEPAEQAAKQGVRLMVVKLEEAKRGFVLLPRRWVVERSFAWAARFRRLARDYERLPSTLTGLHWLAFLTLMLNSIFHQGA